MLADPKLDAVIIATPISTHHALASAALTAGKHVWIEKPFASSSADALDLAGRAERAGVVLLPGHTFLYSPSVVKIKELIDSGELGEIFFVSMSRVNLGLHQPDASVVWDLGPHDFSILRYWLDELPSEMSAMTRSCVLPGVPDVAFINMRFATGAIAHLELSWLSPSKLRRTTVIGSSKMVVYDDASPEPVRVFDSGASLRDPELRRVPALVPHRQHPLAARRRDGAVVPRGRGLLRGDPRRHSRALVGSDRPRRRRSIEAVEDSLAAGGSTVTVSGASDLRAVDGLRP